MLTTVTQHASLTLPIFRQIHSDAMPRARSCHWELPNWIQVLRTWIWYVMGNVVTVNPIKHPSLTRNSWLFVITNAPHGGFTSNYHIRTTLTTSKKWKITMPSLAARSWKSGAAELWTPPRLIAWQLHFAVQHQTIKHPVQGLAPAQKQAPAISIRDFRPLAKFFPNFRTPLREEIQHFPYDKSTRSLSKRAREVGITPKLGLKLFSPQFDRLCQFAQSQGWILVIPYMVG